MIRWVIILLLELRVGSVSSKAKAVEGILLGEETHFSVGKEAWGEGCRGLAEVYPSSSLLQPHT